MPQIALRNVSKEYGSAKVIHGVSMAIDRGEFTVFVGPSGCGKSTLLRALARMLKPKHGTVLLDGHEITKPPSNFTYRDGDTIQLQGSATDAQDPASAIQLSWQVTLCGKFA